MILVHLFIDQHKALSNLNIPINGSFNCIYQDRTLKLQHRQDTTKYYKGHHCTALIGPNGVGKSTILEVLELLHEDTDSRALVVFYDVSQNRYSTCGINMGLGDLRRVEADAPHALVLSNEGFLSGNDFNLVKINNLQSDGLLSLSKRTPEKYIHELTTRENTKSNKRRKSYFNKLLHYFSDSLYRETFMEEIAFAFAFSGSPPSIIQSLLNTPPFNREKNFRRLREWQMQKHTKIQFGDEVNHGIIFQRLISLNALSILSALVSISDLPKSDLLPYVLLEYIEVDEEAETHNGMSHSNRLKRTLHRLHEKGVIDLALPPETVIPQSVLMPAVKKMSARLDHVLDTFSAIAETIMNHCFDGESFDFNRVTTTDYDTIQHLIEMVASLPTNIASTIKWGWRGISSGELARVHIFAEMHAYLKSASKTSNTIILIDEADLYLHPEWQRTLLHDFLEYLVLMRDYDKINAPQLIFCTHSPIIVSDFLPENIVSLTKDEHGQVEVSESFGFGNTIGDIYMNGMHLASTFGEHARQRLDQIIINGQQGNLSEDDIRLIHKIPNTHIKNFLLSHD